MEKHAERVQETFTEAERSLSHIASWCPDADGSLEHSPSGGSLDCKGLGLQKIIPGFLGVAPCIYPRYYLCKNHSCYIDSLRNLCFWKSLLQVLFSFLTLTFLSEESHLVSVCARGLALVRRAC